MKQFTFYIDRKVTMWIRETHLIETETEEKAKEVMINNVREDKTENTFSGQEWLDETITDICREDNLNNPVTELYNEDMELLIEE
jgi:hypothetical protein